MSRRWFLALLSVGALVLVAGGTVAGALIASSRNDDGAKSPGTPAGATTGSGNGYLGLTVSLSAPSAGLRVATIDPGGPADAAGIEVGDVIRAVEDDVVRTPEKLRGLVEARKPGSRVTLTYEHGDRLLQTAVTLAAAPADIEIETPPGGPFGNLLLNRVRLGVRIEQIDATVKAQRNLQRDEGVVVTEVTPGSPAERAGLQPNDIFVSVNGASVDTIEELQRALTSAPANRPAQLRVVRGNETLTLSASLASQISLDGIGSDIVPPQVRERLLQQLERGETSQQQLEQMLRLYRSRSENVRVGTVTEATPTQLKLKLLAGEEATLALNSQTQLRRGRDVIRPADLRSGEMVLVLSMDGGQTAFSVSGFGVLDLP